MQIRILHKLTGRAITYNTKRTLTAPWLFEDVHTKERFTYTPIDNSIYNRVRVGAEVLAVIDKAWTQTLRVNDNALQE